MKKLFVILLCCICLVGCSSNDSKEDDLISYMEAKEKIINNGAMLIDVRTEEEYNVGHIDGAILLPLDTIDEESVAQIIEDQKDPVIVYCKSGNRSHQAWEKLQELGYQEVYDLGAMSNWKE